MVSYMPKVSKINAGNVVISDNWECSKIGLYEYLILCYLSLSCSACVLRKYQVMHSYLSFFIRHKQCIVTWMYQLARSWSYTSSWWWSLLQWTQFHLRLRPHTLLNFKQRLRLLMMLGVIAMFPWQFLIRWDLTYWKQDNFYVSSQSMI